MPPQSPDKAIDAFVSQAEGHASRFYALTSSVQLSGGGEGYSKLSLRRALAVDYFFRVATDWQVLQGDWSIRAVAHRPSGFLRTYAKKLDVDLKKSGVLEKLSQFTEAEVVLPSLGSALTVTRVRLVLDAEVAIWSSRLRKSGDRGPLVTWRSPTRVR